MIHKQILLDEKYDETKSKLSECIKRITRLEDELRDKNLENMLAEGKMDILRREKDRELRELREKHDILEKSFQQSVTGNNKPSFDQ